MCKLCSPPKKLCLYARKNKPLEKSNYLKLIYNLLKPSKEPVLLNSIIPLPIECNAFMKYLDCLKWQ